MGKTENKILRGLVFDDEVSLAVLDTTELVNEAIRIHNLSPLAAAALGRTLTVAAYMCSSLKSENAALSVNIRGDGVGGPICVSGDKDLHMRGTIEDPRLFFPNEAGKLDVEAASGARIPERRPQRRRGSAFRGTTELISGEIGEDFAAYFAFSEQIPTAIAVGVKVGKRRDLSGCGRRDLAAASWRERRKYPQNRRDHGKFPQRQLARGTGFRRRDRGKIFRECQILHIKPEYKCNCSRNYIEGVLLSMGEKELMDALEEEGKICVHCHYCNTDYVFSAEDVEKLLAGART
ncbi:MAG: Hsp33 family molecular chaperone HslO [Candidatus Borkfalkia sp.]